MPSGPNANANPWVGPNFKPFIRKTQTLTLSPAVSITCFRKKDTLSVRYTRCTSDYLQTGGHYGFPPVNVGDATGSSSQKSTIYNITAHYTHVFSPSLPNDLQLAGMRSAHGQGTGADNVNWDSKLGLPNPFGATGWPTIATDAYNFFYGGAQDSDNHKAQNMTPI